MIHMGNNRDVAQVHGPDLLSDKNIREGREVA